MMGKLFGMFKAGGQDFIDDDCMASGAALAYYTIFSMPPLLVLLFFIAGMFNVSEQRITEAVREQIGMPVPQQQSGGPTAKDGGNANQSEQSAGSTEKQSDSSEGGSLTQVADRQSSQSTPLQSLGPVSKIIGALLLIFSATGVFAQLQGALNRAWEVEPDPEQGGLKNFLLKRGLSLGMVIVIAFLLLVSLALTTVIDEIVKSVVGSDPGAVGKTIGIIVNNLVALLVATALFAAMYKILPDAEMRWKDTWVGAFLTAVLFVVGKSLIGWYLQNSQMGDAWGSAASSMVAVLVWVYYTSLIVLFGAELTQVWATRYGHGIVPDEGAVRVVEEKKHVRE